MNPERWSRIQEIFLAASECEATEREAWLSEATAGDDNLRVEVESLLAASDEGEGLIEAAVHGAFELAAVDSEATLNSHRIGPYEVVGELGEGGLSKVYLAERADEHFTMRVAIKVVKRGMDTADILSRLRQERQILASLDHPNVAKLFDGGTTDDGLPYFVMEHIEGEPIDDYCDRLQLSIRQRLELFRTACSAVHYAHQNLVIHRDLKPSNLLVTADGVPKLLDFGIAKVLEAASGEPSLARTVPGMLLLTPEYASPEQAAGEPLTTATDVYSLGVMLYRLLCGHRPHRFTSGYLAEVERVLRESRVERPSVAVGLTTQELGSDGHSQTLGPETVSRPRASSPERLSRLLAGDLDNIVLMAMRREPQRRYASVEQLAEDLKRYLGSLPVLARQDTFAYRTAKFVRRHRGGVIAFALVVVALLAGMATTTWQAKVARGERERAELHLVEAQVQGARAEQISDFLVDLFEISDPGEAQGNRVTAREILDLGARKIRRQLDEQPELQSRLMVTIGRVYRNLGLFHPARELFEEVLESRRRTSGEHSLEAARSLVRVADVVFEQGEWEAAETLLRQALETQRQLVGDEHLDTAGTRHQLAAVLTAADRGEAAEEQLLEALEIRRRLLGDDHLDVAQTRNQLAELYYTENRREEAESLFRQVLAERRRQLGEKHPLVAVSLNNLAVVQIRNDTEAAVGLFRQVLALRREIFTEAHPDLAVSLNNLGTSLIRLERWQESIPPLREALAMNRELLGEDHPSVAVGMNNLASSLKAVGEVEEAEKMLLESLALTRRKLGNEHPDVTLNLFKLASLYAGTGREDAAVPLFEETIRIQRRTFEEGDYRLSYPLVELARLLCLRGDREAAAAPLSEAVEIRRSVFPEDHPHRISAEELLESCL